MQEVFWLYGTTVISSDENKSLQKQSICNMLALAERSWKGGGYGYFDDQTNLLWKNDTGIYTQFVDFENRMLWHKEHTFTNEPFPMLNKPMWYGASQRHSQTKGI